MSLQLRIGQVASLLQITPKTIRHYHKIGLLPEPKRIDNDYRVYTTDTLYQLSLIKSLKSIGFSLTDIKSIIEADNPDAILHQRLDAILQDVDAEIQHLQQLRQTIQTLIRDEVTLVESQQSESTFTLSQMPEAFLQQIQHISPAMLETELEVYKQLDQFHWGAEYHQFLTNLADFFENNPELVDQLTQNFADVDLQGLENTELWDSLNQLLESSGIFDLVADSSFYKDKNISQAFKDVLQKVMAARLSPSQLELLQNLDQRSS